MNFSDTAEWQRANADAISRLAKLGDKLAIRLIEAYRALYADKLSVPKQEEWLKVCDDYARRDLLNTERRLLQDRFGHKIPSDYSRLRF